MRFRTFEILSQASENFQIDSSPLVVGVFPPLVKNLTIQE